MARLLVSDDDPQMLEFVSLVLESAGHQVLATSDAEEVLRLATSMSLDAVVLDVRMPVSGFDLLNELRGHPLTAGLPILFISGLATAEDRACGLREGADDYLVKPFEPDELTLRIERLLAWRTRRASSSGPAPAEADDPLAPPVSSADGGRYLGRYRVDGVIGEGAMGTVYRGWDPRLERPVALKTIRLQVSAVGIQRRDMLQGLNNEAVTVARFNHPNIVAVYDMGDAGGSAFVAMELIDGMSLAQYLEGGPLPHEQLVPLAIGIARGLAAAHAHAVVHRDVKPGNVLLGRDGGVKVTDFGLAHMMSAIRRNPAKIYGTPGYVPPEVMNKEPYAQEGDLFALGATLYESLTGRQPTAGLSLRETIQNTQEGRVTPLDPVAGLPVDLSELVMELLAVEPAKRPHATVAALRLERLAADLDLRWDPAKLPA